MKRATMFGIMKSTYSCYFDPSSLPLTKNSGDIYSAFHKTFDKRFPKFVLNSRSSLRTWQFHCMRTCQANCELGNEVVNFTPNFVGKLTSSLREKFMPYGEIVSEIP